MSTTKDRYKAYLTMDAYQNELNNLHPNFESEDWIINGKNRNKMYPFYGKALRKHDPIAFQVGYEEWVQKNNK